MVRAIRILLVEDDHQVRLLLEHVLLSAGFVVDALATAAEARCMFAVLRYDLFVADALLGDGNGVELAEEAKEYGLRTVIHRLCGPASQGT